MMPRPILLGAIVMLLIGACHRSEGPRDETLWSAAMRSRVQRATIRFLFSERITTDDVERLDRLLRMLAGLRRDDSIDRDAKWATSGTIQVDLEGGTKLLFSMMHVADGWALEFRGDYYAGPSTLEDWCDAVRGS